MDSGHVWKPLVCCLPWRGRPALQDTYRAGGGVHQFCLRQEHYRAHGWPALLSWGFRFPVRMLSALES